MVLPLGDLEKTRIMPIATYSLIALNAVMFLVQADRGEAFTVAYAATPYEIAHHEDLNELLEVAVHNDAAALPRVQVIEQGPVPFPVWLTLFTAMFLHGNVLHLAGNMLYLWIFGDNVEEVLGAPRYVVVYLSCGLIGTLLQVAANPDSVIPTLGASGAIAGVMGAYVVWFPTNRVRVLVLRFIFLCPASVAVGLWIALQVWQGIGSVRHVGRAGGVAYLAHVGGAATGIFVALLFHDRAQYVRMRNAASAGWFEGPPAATGPAPD
jgi:membrane associated rhomboid family serine protease